jgi:hypothetical protein
MVEFCQAHQLRHEVCGKVVVATGAEELPGLEQFRQRGLENGLAVERHTPDQVREREPHVRCLAGIRVPNTGIVSYKQVSLKYAELIRAQGGQIETGARLERIVTGSQTHLLQTWRRRTPACWPNWPRPGSTQATPPSRLPATSPNLPARPDGPPNAGRSEANPVIPGMSGLPFLRTKSISA